MEDRELLELAAKAAGIKIIRSRLGDPLWRDMLIENSNVEQDGNPSARWNPITDDADALRLAVKLGIAPIQHLEERLCAAHWTDIMCRLESYKDDPYAATRRAIVHAAAEIGKQMA